MPENNIDSVVLDQTMSYLRDCHTHQITLTGKILTLNIAALAAFGVILNSSAGENLDTFPKVLVFFFGLFVMIFGAVFNKGASAAHKHLLETEANLKVFINDQVSDKFSARPDYSNVMKTPMKGKVGNLTDCFLLFCGLIWVMLGFTIIYLGMKYGGL